MNIDNLTVSYVTSEDVKALCEFEVQARLTEPGILLNKFDKHEYEKALMDMQINELETNKIVIAKQNGVIVGRCDISMILSLFDFEKTGYIDWVYVLKDKRGLGIGKKLFGGAETYFKSKGVKRYYLFTAENEQAKEFYHRNKELQFSNIEVAEKEIK